MVNKFPILSSIILNENYKVDDIRDHFIWSLNTHYSYYIKYEKILAKMPADEKVYVLGKLMNYCKKHPIMGWSQFTDVLTEVEGYGVLKDLGAKRVRFIREEGAPDLICKLNRGTTILEVKHVHNSDNENDYFVESLTKPRARSVATTVPKELKDKIDKTLNKAILQLNSYNYGQGVPKRMIYLVINPDNAVKLVNELWSGLDSYLLGIKAKIEKQDIELVYEVRW